MPWLHRLRLSKVGEVQISQEEYRRLLRETAELRRLRHNGVFGLGINWGESLTDAARRWYSEFDKVRTDLRNEISILQEQISKAREALHE